MMSWESEGRVTGIPEWTHTGYRGGAQLLEGNTVVGASLGLTGPNTEVATCTVTGDIVPNCETAPSARRCSDRTVKLTDPPKRQVTAANY